MSVEAVPPDLRSRFDELLRPHLPLAYRYALRLASNADDAMDLIQDSAVLAFRAFDKFESGTNFKAWYLRILTNRFYRFAEERARHRTVAIEDAPDLYLFQQTRRQGIRTDGDDPAQVVLGHLDSEAAQRAIEKLPEEYRTVAVLFFIADMRYEEIAEVLEIPVGTVRSRLHRARKALQVSLYDLAQERGLVPTQTD